MSELPETGYLRQPQILGQRAVSHAEAARNRKAAEAAKKRGKKPNARPKRPRPAIPPLIPIGKTKWWEGIRTGRYPRPVDLGPNTRAWRVEDIRTLIESVCVDKGDA
jgi:predicted DNA-binding transcriptional regulator AlpA